MTQKEFAQRTGLAQSSISDWKHKKINPAADKIMIICDVLKVSPYELLSGHQNEKYTRTDLIYLNKGTNEYEVIEKFRGLDIPEQNRVLGYLDALSETGTGGKKTES